MSDALDGEWTTVSLFLEDEDFNIEFINDIINILGKECKTYHYFLEENNEIRFRFKNENADNSIISTLNRLKNDGIIKDLIIERWYGNTNLYGEDGFRAALLYFNSGSYIANLLNSLDKKDKLYSPIDNWSPKHFHLNRYTHLFANQLGYTQWDEFKWSIRYTWNRFLVWFKYDLIGLSEE